MNSVVNELIKLNAEMFAAENKQQIGGNTWEAFFESTLSLDFRIRRANGFVVQNKWEMIEQVRTDDRKRDAPVDVAARAEGDYGVVTSIVTLRGDSSGDKFHNLKLFQRLDSGSWQCVYWRVTQVTKKQ